MASQDSQHGEVKGYRASSCACAFPHTTPAMVDPSSLPPAYGDLYHKSDALSTISKVVDELDSSLREVSVKMHDNPEIRWQEHETMKLLAGYMDKQGWKVKTGVYGTETGFEAVFQHGQGGKVIGFNSEVGCFIQACLLLLSCTHGSGLPPRWTPCQALATPVDTTSSPVGIGCSTCPPAINTRIY